MHFVLSRRRNSGGLGLLAKLVGSVVVTIVGIDHVSVAADRGARPPVPGSFVYCHREHPRGEEVFGGAPTSNGALRFGLTVWNEDGFFFGLWGVANKSSAGWEYRDDMGNPNPQARCDVMITREADGALQLASVGDADCGAMTHGGAEMSLGSLRFAPSTFEGPVTWQLDDGDTFGNSAGRCSLHAADEDHQGASN